MNICRGVYVAICTIVSLIISTTTHASPAVDAPSISLKYTCGTDQNCFSDPAAMLSWIWGVRDPTTANPLIVNIDPGQFIFPDTTTCSTGYPTQNPGRGNVTFHGSGRDNTVLTGGGTIFINGVLNISGCNNLSFQDMTIRASLRGGASTGSGIAVVWENAGSSNWTNMALEGAYGGWYDSLAGGTACSGSVGHHNWFSSTISAAKSSTKIAYLSACGDSKFWGSEIATINDGSPEVSTGSEAGTGFSVSGSKTVVHLYGSDVSVTTTASGIPGPQTGLYVRQGGTVHIHGGEIVVRQQNPSATQGVTAISANGTGTLVHTPETSFGLLTPSGGVATRIKSTNGATVQSPFRWSSGFTPPTGGSALPLVSSDGEDMFVQTNCSSSGCVATGTETHLLVYNNSCTVAGPWFDTVTKACRQ